MNKYEFLRELKNNLIGKVKDDDLQNIIMDYEEIFEENKSENKTEDETSNMIGSPAIVAKNILDDYTDNRTSKSNMQSSYQIAPFGKRIAAFIIDSILSLIPVAIFTAAPRLIVASMLFAPIIPSLPLTLYVRDYMPTSTQIATNLAFIFVFWLYGTITMIVLKNKTIGMSLMRIKVIKSNNTSLKIIDIIIRQFLGKIIIPGLTFGLSNVFSLLWALLSKTNNTIQDKIAATLVVEDIREKQVR